MSARSGALVGLVGLASFACTRSQPHGSEAAGGGAAVAGEVPATAVAASPSGARGGAPGAADDEPLEAEERERTPPAETVKLRLSIAPAVEADVFHGREHLGRTRPGAMNVDIVRRRDSGPLDVSIRAKGFLVHRVRLFTDRNDRLFIRLLRPEETVGMLGYRPPDGGVRAARDGGEPPGAAHGSPPRDAGALPGQPARDGGVP